jgi:hypothetical protein
MTQQQPYEVAEPGRVRAAPLPAHLVAEIEVAGSFDEAPSRVPPVRGLRQWR